MLWRETIVGFGLKPDAVVRREAVDGEAAVLIGGERSEPGRGGIAVVAEAVRGPIFLGRLHERADREFDAVGGLAFEVDKANAERLFRLEFEVDAVWQGVEVELLPDDGVAISAGDKMDVAVRFGSDVFEW